MALGHPSDQEMILYEDGTTFWSGAGNYTNLSLQTTSVLAGINRWGASGNVPLNTYTAFLFPEPRNITAFSLVWVDSDFSDRGVMSIETSADAVNPGLGTWTQRYVRSEIGYWREQSAINIPKLRVPWAVNWASVKGIRMRTGTAGSDGYSEVHFWGDYSRAGLVFWDATNDTLMNGANFDFGEVVRSSTQTRTFRIKNTRNMIANDVVVAATAGMIGGIAAGLQFSDGGAYQSSLSISSIPANSISGVITARRIVGAAETIQVGCSYVSAKAGSWT